MNYSELLTQSWGWGVLAVSLGLGVAVGIHAVLNRRDAQSALAWVALIIMVPLLGAAAYALFGVNRIRREGVKLRRGIDGSRAQCADGVCAVPESEFKDLIPLRWRYLATLELVLAKSVPWSLTKGNQVMLLRSPEEAYDAMLRGIRSARKSVALASYIFERRGIGAAFAEELGNAVSRGVEVRVMIDDAGTRYSWPPIVGELRARGITVQRFMPTRWVWRLLTCNLRNHRKILVVDGISGFTGGLNIRQGFLKEAEGGEEIGEGIRDLHFKVVGPILGQLMEVFAEDWAFCAGERLDGDLWFPKIPPNGDVLARGIVDGPDEDFEVMQTTLLAALTIAREEVSIVTPYFIPDTTLIAALQMAALRGVSVTVVLPSKNNLPFVHWASQTTYEALIEKGVKIIETAPPFDHSKLFIVDGRWSLIGSTNWDPRSLRLNFEFNVACYDRDLARELQEEAAKREGNGREVTLEELHNMGFWRRIRNGIARLASPLL